MAFGGPDIPAVAPPPPAPTTDDAQTRKKLEDAAAAERNARGRRSTILSGTQGDQSNGNVSKRTLLGS